MVLRSIGKGVGVILLFISVISFIILIPLGEMTSHDNMKELFISAFSKTLAGYGPDENITETHENLKRACELGMIDEYKIQMVKQTNVTLSCAEINATTADELPSLIAGRLFEDLWSKDFGCKFITCLRTLPSEEKPGLFFSSVMHDFLLSIRWYILLGMVVAGIMAAALSRSVEDALKSLGIPLSFAGASVLLTKLIKDFVFREVSAEANIIGSLLNTLFDKITYISLIVLAIGIVLIASSWVITRHIESSKG